MNLDWTIFASLSAILFVLGWWAIRVFCSSDSKPTACPRCHCTRVKDFCSRCGDAMTAEAGLRLANREIEQLGHEKEAERLMAMSQQQWREHFRAQAREAEQKDTVQWVSRIGEVQRRQPAKPGDLITIPSSDEPAAVLKIDEQGRPVLVRGRVMLPYTTK